ncbi:hypothetical protein ACIQUQ_33025 [Streptomyces sp. NPDC101118]|uniref:hypothetical protein n=1 Tax=Streptomyces sp. NPDC101118 TaxID=3366109 RepID=UPI003805286A
MDAHAMTFNHVDHPLLKERVVDTHSLREGVLEAVLVEDGKRVAYIRGDDHLEFDAPIEAVRAAQ